MKTLRNDASVDFVCTIAKRSLATVALLLPLAFATYASAQRDLKDIPDPDPELERKSFIVADGFEVNLFAADPQMAKPIQMNFDAQGRLWIASSEVYPHIKPGQKPTDKILVLEDADADGKSDKTTVFADGLLIPTGVVPGDGGCYVANSTELIHLFDSDDDGKSDQRRVVLSGFGTEDTHHLLHTLRWGHDGMLYMNQSIYIHSHIETPYGVKHLNAGGIWQFRPETMRLDVFCRGFVNPWGHHFDHWGQSFATDGAYGEGINYVFPGSVFVTAVNAKRILKGLNPGSPKHCGLEIVSGRHLPPDWKGNMITNDFRAHRVCRFVVSEDGSGYASRQETELIKTTHVAFRPIDVKMGPDGAIYIADWYNPIIQHGEVDFRDPRRDHVHGRIWRVTAKDRPTLKHPDLVNAKIPQLLDYLKSPEEWVRLHAKLMLKAYGRTNVAGPLERWLASLDAEDPDSEHHRLEGLWAYQCVNQVEPKLLGELLNSKDHRVRAAAMRVTSQWHDRLEQTISTMRNGVADEHPRVRLEAVRALSQMQSVDAARYALFALDQPMDRFLDFALWQAMRDLEPYWLPAVREGREDFGGNIEHLTFALQSVDSPAIVEPLLKLVEGNRIREDRVDSVLTLIATLGGPDELAKVFKMVSDAGSDLPAASKATLLEALVATTLQRKTIPAGDLTGLPQLFGAADKRLRMAALRAAGVWKQENLRNQLSGVALDTSLDRPLRDAAIDAITSMGGPESVKTLNQLSQSKDMDDRLRAVNGLSVIAPKMAAQRAAALLAELPAEIDPSVVVANLLARKTGPAELTVALADQKLTADTAKRTLRAARSASQQSPELIDAIQKAGGLSEAGWKLTPELRDQLVAEVTSKGNPHQGEIVFRRNEMQCLKCHAIGGAGGRVGPDLVSIGASAQIDYLIDSLIEPNKKIKENFHTLSIVTDGGQVFTGVPVRRGDGQIVLRTADDKEVTIVEAEIDEQKDGRSLMVDGAVDSLTRTELVDLVRFLSELGKVGDFAIGKTPVVRRWETLVWTKEAHHRINRTSYDTASTEDDALTWQSAYSRVAGDLPLESLPKFDFSLNVFRKKESRSFVRFQVDVTTAGEVQFVFNSESGLQLWVNDKPTPPEQKLTVNLSKGRHTLTLAIDQINRSEPLFVELGELPDSPARSQLIGGK